MKRFDKYEKRGAYHWVWYASNFGNYRDVVDMAVKQFPEKGTILDIGCGDGLTTYMLRRHGLDAVGIDPNKCAINLAKRNVLESGEDVVFSVRDFSAVRGEYDYILCHAVIEHVIDYRGLLQKIKSSMRKYAIISTANGEHQKGDGYDENIWTPAELEKIFDEEGLKWEQIYIDKVLVYYKVEKK